MNENARDVPVRFRVRYCETDQMGALNSARALEWFELGRTEWLRAAGLPYADLERSGVFLPVVEAYCRFCRRVRYDEPIALQTRLARLGRASVRFSYVATLDEQDGAVVLTGWTEHAFVDAAGKVIRPPRWLVERLKSFESRCGQCDGPGRIEEQAGERTA